MNTPRCQKVPAFRLAEVFRMRLDKAALAFAAFPDERKRVTDKVSVRQRRVTCERP